MREYATYILHLESALSQVDEALQTYSACHAAGNKRSSKRIEDTDLGRLGKALMALEEVAAERGESGLVISLSKPFQRLLKYPLLFQNLLFNTDPSLKEYEATLNMVDEVEEIVRTIEDEKASSEEREKTRDVWARIDGLDKDKVSRFALQFRDSDLVESILNPFSAAHGTQSHTIARERDPTSATRWSIRRP